MKHDLTSKNYFVKKTTDRSTCVMIDPKRLLALSIITGKYIDYFPSFVAHSHFDFNQVYCRQESANEW